EGPAERDQQEGDRTDQDERARQPAPPHAFGNLHGGVVSVLRECHRLRDPLVLPGSRGLWASVGPAKDTRRIHADPYGRASRRHSRCCSSETGKAAENTRSGASAAGGGGASSGVPCACVYSRRNREISSWVYPLEPSTSSFR